MLHILLKIHCSSKTYRHTSYVLHLPKSHSVHPSKYASHCQGPSLLEYLSHPPALTVDVHEILGGWCVLGCPTSKSLENCLNQCEQISKSKNQCNQWASRCSTGCTWNRDVTSVSGRDLRSEAKHLPICLIKYDQIIKYRREVKLWKDVETIPSSHDGRVHAPLQTQLYLQLVLLSFLVYGEAGFLSCYHCSAPFFAFRPDVDKTIQNAAQIKLTHWPWYHFSCGSRPLWHGQ